jgi:O-antigen ligase
LFAASIISINAYGSVFFWSSTGRAEIWTLPKLFFVFIITILNFWVSFGTKSRIDTSLEALSGNALWIVLWSFYLTSAIVSTISSPFPFHSLIGHPVLGDGCLYYFLLAAFATSNGLTLRSSPRLFKGQLYGLVIGGIILALSIIPQSFNWQIDYTVTSGQVSDLDPQLLRSSIWQMQMPIGLYSNRGHASFVLSAGICSLVAAWFNSWLKHYFWKVALLVMVVSLCLTQTLAGIGACLLSIAFLLFKGGQVHRFRDSFWQYSSLRKALTILLAFIIFITFIVFISNKLGKSYINVEELLTGRLYLWEVSIEGIFRRPWLGWGFNGFGISHLFTGDWVGLLNSQIPNATSVSKILDLHETTFDFLDMDGEIHSGAVFSHKAHNIFLDLALSTGLPSAIAYLFLMLYSLCKLLGSTKWWPMSSIVIAYLLFTQTWFESAQFSHLPWWCLSLTLSTPKSPQS